MRISGGGTQKWVFLNIPWVISQPKLRIPVPTPSINNSMIPDKLLNLHLPGLQSPPRESRPPPSSRNAGRGLSTVWVWPHSMLAWSPSRLALLNGKTAAHYVIQKEGLNSMSEWWDYDHQIKSFCCIQDSVLEGDMEQEIRKRQQRCIGLCQWFFF